MFSSKNFIKMIGSRIWKLLPLRDQYDKGEDVHLFEYARSLTLELMGAFETYPDLLDNSYFITIVNTMQYLNKYTVTHGEWRSEVLKMLNIQNKILRAYCDNGIETSNTDGKKGVANE